MSMTNTTKAAPCPFCGATPHHGLGKVQHCQLHGDPFQDFSIWCPKGHAKITAPNEEMVLERWNRRHRLASSPVEGEACRRCGAHNPPWSAPSPLWNAVMRGGSINGEALFDDMVCATCFMTLAEQAGAATLWRVSAERVNVELETVTPSGRVWNEKAGLWQDASPPPDTEARAREMLASINQLSTYLASDHPTANDIVNARRHVERLRAIEAALASGRGGVIEECARVADGWANTKPESGPMAGVIAGAMNCTATSIASAIRDLGKSGG